MVAYAREFLKVYRLLVARNSGTLREPLGPKCLGAWSAASVLDRIVSPIGKFELVSS